MIHPYVGANFFDFLITLAYRLVLFVFGQIPLKELAPDEVQIACLIAVTLSASLVGTFLVLKRMTMLANSLSHTILLGIISAFILLNPTTITLSPSILLLGAFISGLLTAFLTEFLTKICRIQEDASNALVFTTLFALGILLVSIYAHRTHLGREMVIGSLDALHVDDLKFLYGTLLFNLCVTLALFRVYKLMTFDPLFAQTIGFSITFYNYILMAQVSLTTVAGFRAVGVLMLLALIVAPTLIARLFTNRLIPLIALSSIVGILISIVGVGIARHLLSVWQLPLSTAGVVITLFFAVYLILTFLQNLNFKRKWSEIR